MRAVQWWGCITPIACMPAGMRVRQQVAALGIVFFIRVLQYLSVYNVHATGCDVIVRHIEEDLWVLVVCALLAHPPWRSSSTSLSARGLIKATHAGLVDAAEALGGRFGHTRGRHVPKSVFRRNGCGMSSKSHSSWSMSSKSSMS